MCFVAMVQTGCGTTGSAAVQPGRSIDLQNYKLLREVHMELGQFIYELNQAIQLCIRVNAFEKLAPSSTPPFI